MSFNKPLVAFDIGNVLCRVDFDPFLELGLKLEVFPSLVLADEWAERIQPEHDVGLLSMEDALRGITDDESRVKQLLDCWLLDVITLSKPMLTLVEQLKKRRPVALLSNVGKEHSGIFNMCRAFDGCLKHFSCEVGARKPSKLFFQSFYIEQGWKGIWRSNGNHKNYSLFFDDRQENVDASQPFFQGRQFSLDDYETDEEAAKAIREMLTAADEPC
jgi:FMN phosphatase YigB (HAD superfamily)